MTEKEARDIAAPDSWSWPMSEDAKRWVDTICKQKAQRGLDDIKAANAARKPVGEQFDHEEHERFMRGLG
jgi:hypothetical protein